MAKPTATNDLPDAATVIRLRELVHSPSIRSALLHSSDTLLAFALRAVEHLVADQSQTDREIITRLWDVLEDTPEPSPWDDTELTLHARTKLKETLTPQLYPPWFTSKFVTPRSRHYIPRG